MFGPSDASSDRFACAILSASAGLMSQLRNHRSGPKARVCISKIKPLNNLPISRRTAFVPDVMKLSSNPIRAKR